MIIVRVLIFAFLAKDRKTIYNPKGEDLREVVAREEQLLSGRDRFQFYLHAIMKT